MTCSSKQQYCTYLRAIEFEDKGAKIIWALTYIKGPEVDSWVENLLEHRIGKISWDEFIAAFRTCFSNHNPAETARNYIDQIQQGMRSADMYMLAFMLKADKTGYNNTALINTFKKGLSTPISHLIHSHLGLPKTIEGWYNSAIRAESQINKEKKTASRATLVFTAWRGVQTSPTPVARPAPAF